MANKTSRISQMLLASVAVAGMLALPSAAHADAYALAQETIDNLVLSVTGPGAGSGFNSFNFLSKDNTSIVNAGGNDLAPAVSHTSSNPQAAYSFTHDAAGVNQCFAANASGGCAATPGALTQIGSNHPPVSNSDADFTPAGKGGATGRASYAFATSVIPDTRINLATGVSGGGFVKQIAETNVAGGAHGNGQSGQALQQWTFTLQLGAGSDVNINYNVHTHLIADSTDLNAKKTVATAVTEYSLAFCGNDPSSCTADPGNNAHANPAPDNKVVSANTGSIATFDQTSNVNIDLLPSQGTGFYQISITVSDNAEAFSTPEPMTLSIMGLGLLGLGAATRRRRVKKAA